MWTPTVVDNPLPRSLTPVTNAGSGWPHVCLSVSGWVVCSECSPQQATELGSSAVPQVTMLPNNRKPEPVWLTEIPLPF
eukprot:COSAG01_NODE_45052_length_413_cov_0.659236_1_plen_78_part_01